MPNTVQFHRVLRASPERIYRAFLDPDAMVNLPRTPQSRSLVIRPTAGRPLSSKQERAFNRALRNVQVLCGRLEEEKRRLDQALVFHAAQVGPRVERAVALRVEPVRWRPSIIGKRE